MMLWEDAANKYPLNARAVSNYGIALMNQRSYNEAIPLLKRAAEINPKDSILWYNLGTCFKLAGQTDKSIESYEKALELNPRYQKASVDLGLIYVSKHNFTKAWDIMLKAKSYNPEHPYNNALTAEIYCETGDLKQAKSLFEKAVKSGLDHSDMYFNFAICLLNHRFVSEARQNFLKVIEFNSNEIESYYFIAITYDREKNYQKALYFYNMFLSKATKSQWIEEVRQRVQQLQKKGIVPQDSPIPAGTNQSLPLI